MVENLPIEEASYDLKRAVAVVHHLLRSLGQHQVQESVQQQENSDLVAIRLKSLQHLIRDLEGANKQNWRYHHATGWNEAIRYVMAAAQQVNQKAEPGAN